MPIQIVCPKCSAKLNAPDTAVGKRVKCPKQGCGTAILVPEPPEPQFEVVDDKPTPKPAQKKAVKAVIEDDPLPKKKSRKTFDDDEEDEKPRSKRRRDDDDDEEDEKPRSKRRRDDDDDEDDDRPKQKRSRDDDEDEDEDRPLKKKKKKKKKSGGLPPAAIAGIALGGVLLLGGIGYGVYALAFKDSNTANSKTTNSNSGGGGSDTQAKASVPQGWVEFKKEGAGFKAYFPVKPKEINSLGAKIYEGEDTKIDCGCTVITQVTRPIVPEKRKEAGEELAKTIFDVIGAKILSRKDATLAGIAGTEMIVAEPDKSAPSKGPPSKTKSGEKAEGKGAGRAVFRVIISDNTLIIAGVTSDSGTPKPEWVSGFFDNFELVK
jgi:hypothetical protein